MLFIQVVLGVILALIALIVGAKTLLIWEENQPSQKKQSYARWFLACWLNGGFDHLNRGLKLPKQKKRMANMKFDNPTVVDGVCRDMSIPQANDLNAWAGDFVVSKSFYQKAAAMGQNRFDHAGLIGYCMINDGQTFVQKKVLFMHGSTNAENHMQEWFFDAIEEVDVVVTCNWAIVLPSYYHHKAWPVIWNKITGRDTVWLNKTRNRAALSLPHSIIANWSEDRSELDSVRFEWGQVWDRDQNGIDYLVFGTAGVVNSRIISRYGKSRSAHLKSFLSSSIAEKENRMKLEEQVVMPEKETNRRLLIKEGSKSCRRLKDGSITMKFKGSPYLRVFNEITGSTKARPIIVGHGSAPDENLQGVLLPQVCYREHVGEQGTLPLAKLANEEFIEGTYRRIGYAWKGVANFGIYGGKTEEEEARSASAMRIQHPRNFVTGENFEILFLDASNPMAPQRLIEEGVVISPKDIEGVHELLAADMQGLDHAYKKRKKKPEIDGTIWVSSQGPNFAPPMPKGDRKATYQFRGTCVFPKEVGDALQMCNEGYESLFMHLKAILNLSCEAQYDVNEFVNIAFQSKDEYILDWIGGRTKEEILSYIKTSDTIRGFDILQIICGDLAIKTNIAIHQEYFDATEHYGAYLKGAVATRSYINKGVVLIEINAVKDISKHALKKALKENGGVVRAHHGHEYIIGMMQDYSRGGIRVQSQPNTYIRSHYYDDSFVMADHIDRFADFLYELMEQISKGIAVEEIIKNLKTGMRFTNAGESDLELGEFLADLEETARGFLPAMWNHQMGRSIIKNTFKVLCARYSFGFMTSAMKRIGTFVSVKSYITDLNILPAAYQNKAYHKDSVFVKFDNGQKFKQRLPLTVVLYVNEQFWNKMEVTSCLAGILRYPVSNEDMFSGCLVVSPDSIIEDEEIRRLAGFSGYSEELLEWFFAGMSNGIYANSITIKELLCGDSDGDTAGLVPMDVKFDIQGSNIIINMDSPDAKFLWAIHEVRDLKKRKFLELEGFTYMQGNRKISPAAVEHVLAESNKAIGPCALFQQSTKGILDTYDKDLFIVRERPSWQKPREGEVRIKEGKEMATFKWFIERYIIPVYRILPCSLELAIMSQKKDLMKAFQYVTSLLLDDSGEVKYGERGERSCEMFDVALVAELEKQADADYVFHISSKIAEIVDLTDWAKEMGLITRNVLRSCSIGTAAGFINWASATRTTAMAKKENPETLLADQTDEGWGIRQADNLAWTNNEWVQYIKPVFVRVREAMDRMIHNDRTFGEDMDIRLSWNRVYDRGSFNRLNLNLMTDLDGIVVPNKQQFLKDVAHWFEVKITSRLFGLNLHGWGRFTGSKKKIKDLPEARAIYINTKNDVFAMVLAWAYFQMHTITRSNVHLNKFYAGLVDDIEHQTDLKEVMNFIVQNLTNKTALENGIEDLKWLAEYAKIKTSDDSLALALELYTLIIKSKIETSEYLWTIKHAYMFLFEQDNIEGLREKLAEVQKQVSYIYSALRVDYLFYQGELNQPLLKEIYSQWKKMQMVATKFLATKYRELHKSRLAEMVDGWNESHYSSLFALGHQETQYLYGMNFNNSPQRLRKFYEMNNGLNSMVTDYSKYLVFSGDLPTTFCSFLKADRLLLEVVSTEMEHKRIAFSKTNLQFTFIEKKGVELQKGAFSISPFYQKEGDVELHAIEVRQNDQVVGWLASDPTARILFYFEDKEMEIVDFTTHLSIGGKASNSLGGAQTMNNALLLNAPHSIEDQKAMVNRFVMNCEEAHEANFRAILISANMSSMELLFSLIVNKVNSIISMINKKFLTRKNTLEYFVSSEQNTQMTGLAKKMAGSNYEDFLLQLWRVVLNRPDFQTTWNKRPSQDSGERLTKPLELVKDIIFTYGDMTFNYANGTTEIDQPEDYLSSEEEMDSMAQADAEVIIPQAINDFSHYDDIVYEEDQEEMDYPEDDPIFVVQHEDNNDLEELEEEDHCEEEPMEELEELSEEEEKEEVVVEEIPEPVVIAQKAMTEQEILAAISELSQQLSTPVAKVFDKAVAAGMKEINDLRKKKVELENKKAAAMAELARIQAELAAVEEQLEDDDDDDPTPPPTPSAPKKKDGEIYSNVVGSFKLTVNLKSPKAVSFINNEFIVNLDLIEKQFEELEFVTPKDPGSIALDPATFENGSEYGEYLICLAHEMFKSTGEESMEELQIKALKQLGKEVEVVSMVAEKKKVVLVVTGGRDFNDRAFCFEQLDKIHSENPFDVLVSGMASGLDTLAVEWAKTKNLEVIEMPANWNRQPDGSYDKGAGFKRNTEMAQISQICAVFPGGNGTAHMKKTCKDLGLQIIDCAAAYKPQSSVETITIFRDEMYFLSNMFFSKVVHQNIVYRSVEHFYQVQKFKHHPEIQQEIMRARSPYDSKKIANKNKDKIREDWDDVKDRVMWYGLKQKFVGYLRDKLLATGDSRIVHENQHGDTYWGTCRGKGQNRLGEMLEALREQLKN